MKKLILSASLLILGANAFAQENDNGVSLDGRWFIMGQAGYNSSNEGNTQSYSIVPQVGNFVSEDVALGLGIGYIGSKNESEVNNVTNTQKENLFVVKPFARKYWGVAKNLFVFGELSVPLGFGKNTSETSLGNTTTTGEAKYTNIGVQVATGLDYYLSDNWSLEAAFGLLGWSSTKPKDGDSANSFNFGLNSGVDNGVKIGIKYTF
ncbi:outer membrane beta-barrel protein [Empedobacter sedimenti]|uniref:outer membrane beta-barrel protein n=1 Tax=Empedobacter sedimenti TaxID=3042610 RepID=UPI0024A6BA40|nr:outer membrane beta-barrel protein [Empedobacter sedimenti]